MRTILTRLGSQPALKADMTSYITLALSWMEADGTETVLHQILNHLDVALGGRE